MLVIRTTALLSPENLIFDEEPLAFNLADQYACKAIGDTMDLARSFVMVSADPAR